MLVTQNANVAPEQIINGDWEPIGGIDVPSRTSPSTPVRLVLGIYQRSEPEPMLVLDIEPSITTSNAAHIIKQLLDRDTYILAYQFSNLSDTMYHVQVWQSRD